jgi:hypothetical protein
LHGLQGEPVAAITGSRQAHYNPVTNQLVSANTGDRRHVLYSLCHSSAWNQKNQGSERKTQKTFHDCVL